jgi:hypothetical protein
MVVAEIAAGLTSLRTALDISKAMIGLRDAEAFRAKSIELQAVILDAMNQAIESREAYAAQIDQIRALEAEVARLKDWNAEKENYELKPIGPGAVAYMLKPDKRGAEPPHWLCPTCYAKGEKSFLSSTGKRHGQTWIYKCSRCGAEPAAEWQPMWKDARTVHVQSDDA